MNRKDSKTPGFLTILISLILEAMCNMQSGQNMKLSKVVFKHQMHAALRKDKRFYNLHKEQTMKLLLTKRTINQIMLDIWRTYSNSTLSLAPTHHGALDDPYFTMYTCVIERHTWDLQTLKTFSHFNESDWVLRESRYSSTRSTACLLQTWHANKLPQRKNLE